MFVDLIFACHNRILECNMFQLTLNYTINIIPNEVHQLINIIYFTLT